MKRKRQEKDGEVFLTLQLEEENERFVCLTKLQWESLIISSLDRLHGQVGAGIVFDVVSVDGKNAKVVLNNRSLPTFWSALTFQMAYNSKPCMIHVKKD